MVLGCGESAEERRFEEERLIDKVMILKSTEAAQEYLDRYPDGEQAALCKNIINDDATFSNASDAKTLEPLIKYLDTYPSGRHADEASKKIREMLFSINDRDIALTEQKKVLKNYLRLAPDGAFSAQAAGAIDNICWLETCWEDSAVSYINYMGKGGKYDEDANLRITGGEKHPELQELRLGMEAGEVQRLLGPPAIESQILTNVGGISEFGYFYDMQYPEKGVHCHVRRHSGKAVIYELHFFEPFASDFNGIRIGMAWEDVTKLYPNISADNKRFEKTYIFDLNGSAFYVELSCSANMGTDSTYLRVTTNESNLYYPQYKFSRFTPWNAILSKDGTLTLNRWVDDAVLSGEKLYAQKSYPHNRVISIHRTSHTLRGNFAILPSAK